MRIFHPVCGKSNRGGLYFIAFELFERYTHCALADLNVRLWLNRSIGPGRQADECSSQRAGFWLDDGVDAGDWLAGACCWKVHCSRVIYAEIISICHSLMWKTNRTCGYRSCHLSAGTCGGRTGGLLPSAAVNSSMMILWWCPLQKHSPWLPKFMTKHHHLILIIDCQISSVNTIFKKDHVYQCAYGNVYKNTPTHTYVHLNNINKW